MDLERLRLHHYEHSAGRGEEICRCGHERQEHELTSGSDKPYMDDISEPCDECDCLGFSPPEPDYDAIFERRREERYFG